MTNANQLVLPTAEGVARAAAKIAEILPPTPLLPVEHEGRKFWLKAECLQPIGAFKIRGGWNRLSDLSAEERALGVVAVSSGNHAQGVAWAARRLDIAATIVMPSDAPAIKVNRTRELGAQIVFYDRMTENREEIALAIVMKTGAILVHAFADRWVIEGQGSAGIEIAHQLGHQPSRILACCGGGGLSAGLALACPDAEVIPVEPEGWDDVCRSLEAGAIQSVRPNPPPTACDALQTLATAEINFAVLKERCVSGLRVSEEEVRHAQRFAAGELRLVLEPGGAVALAAALAGKVEVDGNTVVIATGGNTDLQAIAAVLQDK
ncbi:threonine ammonia-lyase [Alteraurantiacibacter aquimixticola]|uniref:Pyridoxal-phosphate dependent enzyme n=1 Tax=Alteraurantiacibacter aquimixticola TaxID=2489173 RepID=A0A4T3F4A8_9SPHN|nr:pyridoxal-phosphate dependent enzyme [Alteraurantiacibacter aquimixticola]TIX51998.1 pyridoxal-phosphate dependent enzyme [Alteraurantiacibacter aquimixticola]